MSGLLIRFVNPPYAHDYFAYESVVLQEDWAVLCITDPVIWPSEAGIGLVRLRAASWTHIEQ